MKAVGIIIFSDDRQKILLSKRSANEEDEKGKWENVGGKVEKDESFEDAVHREIHEELGVHAKNLNLELTYGEENSDFCIKVYSVNIEGEPQIMEPLMCDEIRWVMISDLKDMDLAKYSKEDFIKLNWI